MRTKITIGCFLALLALFFLTVAVLPRDEQAAVLENRALQEFPELTAQTLFSGQFPSQFETYLSDNVGFRSVWTDLAARFEDSKGLSLFGKLVKTTGDLGVGQTTENQLLVIDDRVMEVYRKDDRMQKKYVDMVNYYAENLPETITLYNMLIPTQIAFMEEYSGLGDNELESIEEFYNAYLPRVKTIDVSRTLGEQFLGGKYVYFRTDHHWTTLGAYYAYQTMADAMGMPKLNLADFWIGDEAPFLGHLYAQAKTPRLKAHADTIYYYVNDMNNISVKPVTYSYYPGQRLEYEGKMFCPEEGARYELFLAGDHPFIEINSESENDRTLLLIKDSYSNALLPWLTCGYRQILVVDARTFDQTIDTILTQYEVDDVLLANYIMGTNFEDYIDLCTEIYKEAPAPAEIGVGKVKSFADKLNEQMPDDKNYVFSPLSIKMNLMLAANGATGQTQREILKTAGVAHLDDYNESVKTMRNRYSRSKTASVHISNSIWINADKTTQKFSNEYKKYFPIISARHPVR